MKYLIVSDIHGSIDSARRIIDIFEEEKCDIILNLGDVLYHGPRNDLPEFYAPKEVIKLLNEYSDKTICINGNCDAEVDQMVLDFKIEKNKNLMINGLSAHLEHGHHLDQYNGKHKVILYGHTHIPVIEEKNGQVFINPGSATIPKNGSKRGYAIWDKHSITLYTLDKEEIKKYTY